MIKGTIYEAPVMEIVCLFGEEIVITSGVEVDDNVTIPDLENQPDED